MTTGPVDGDSRPRDGRTDDRDGAIGATGRAGRTGDRDAAIAWPRAHVDSAFAAIVSQAQDAALTSDRVPPAEWLPDEPIGRHPGVFDQAGRIASALFCTGRLDPAFVAFAVGRAAEHGRVDAGEVVDLVAGRVLAIAAGLLASSSPSAIGSPPAVAGARTHGRRHPGAAAGRVGRRGAADATGEVHATDAA